MTTLHRRSPVYADGGTLCLNRTLGSDRATMVMKGNEVLGSHACTLRRSELLSAALVLELWAKARGFNMC